MTLIDDVEKQRLSDKAKKKADADAAAAAADAAAEAKARKIAAEEAKKLLDAEFPVVNDADAAGGAA